METTVPRAKTNHAPPLKRRVNDNGLQFAAGLNVGNQNHQPRKLSAGILWVFHHHIDGHHERRSVIRLSWCIQTAEVECRISLLHVELHTLQDHIKYRFDFIPRIKRSSLIQIK
jgi:hypothetical protein